MTTRSEYGKFHGLKTGQDWMDHFRNNLHSGIGLSSMYSCPICDEILLDISKKHQCQQKRNVKKIYESPDKGKTIYERNFGDYKSRIILIKALTKMPKNSD